MNEDIQKELKEVEQIGIRMAKKFMLQKFVVLLVALSAILLSFRLYDSYMFIFIEILVLIIILQFIKKNQKQFQIALYEKCDPYLQYIVIDHYRNNWRIMPNRLKNQLLIAMAQCMVLAGEPQEAISISNQIEKPSHMKINFQSIYYNNLLNAYSQFGWEYKRSALIREIKELRARCNKKDAMYLDVILRLEELHSRHESLDLEYIQTYFQNNPPQHLFQKVGMHYYIADILIKLNRSNEAEESIAFVIKFGNKLYYKKELNKLLRMV